MKQTLRFRDWIVAAAAVVLVAGFLAGCSEPKEKWEAQGATESQVSLDRAYCRKRADEVAGAEFEQDLSSSRIGGGSSSVLEGFAQTDAKRYRRKLFTSCMGSLGYKQVQ